MIEKIRKYLLTLCIFLLSGGSYLYACWQQPDVSLDPVIHIGTSVYVSTNEALTNQIRAAGHILSEKEEAEYKTIYSEEEEKGHRLILLKKRGETPGHFLDFHPGIDSTPFGVLKKSLLRYERFLGSSASRYLLFRVLRI